MLSNFRLNLLSPSSHYKLNSCYSYAINNLLYNEFDGTINAFLYSDCTMTGKNHRDISSERTNENNIGTNSATIRQNEVPT